MKTLIYFAMIFTLGTVFAADSSSEEALEDSPIEQIKEAASTFANLWTSYSQMDPEDLTDETKKELIDLYRDYQRLLEAHLNKLGIAFRWENFPSLYLERLIGQEETLFITPGNQSPLNRLAKELDTKYDVGLIYDQVSLRKYMGQAAYSPQERVLYLDIGAAASRYPEEWESVNTGHELVHVKSHAYRRGLTESEGNHPLQITVQNGGHIFHGDELIAHAFNISQMAKSLRWEDNPGKRSKMAPILSTSKKLTMDFATNILHVTDSIRKNKLVEKNEFKSIKDSQKITWISLEDKKQNISLKIFLHPKEAKAYKQNPVNWIKLKIKRAETLAQFSLNYMEKYPEKNSDYFKHMEAYRSLQAELIEKLK